MHIRFKKNKFIDELVITVENDTRNQQVENIFTYLNDYEHQHDVLTVEKNGDIYKIPFTDLLWLEVIGDHTSIYTEDLSINFRKTLQSIESELPSRYFVRVSRNTIVNLKKISKVERSFSGTMRAILAQKYAVHISRNYWKNIKQRILNDD